MRTFLAIALLLILAATSLMRNAAWEDDAAIWNGVIETFPLRARAYNEVGLHWLAEGSYGEALRYLTRSLEIDPYQQQIWNNVGQAYERLGQIDQAIRAYERAIWSAPNDATPYYNLGVLYLGQRKDMEKASEYLIKARDLNPLEPDIHYQLNRLYTELGDTSKARDELARFNYLKR